MILEHRDQGNQLFQYGFMYIIQLKLSKKIHIFLKKKKNCETNELFGLNKMFNFYKTQSIPLIDKLKESMILIMNLNLLLMLISVKIYQN